MAFDITPLKPGSMVALFSLSLALSRMGGGNGLAFNSLVFVIQSNLAISKVLSKPVVAIICNPSITLASFRTRPVCG
jgi:hypothetical protein